MLDLQMVLEERGQPIELLPAIVLIASFVLILWTKFLRPNAFTTIFSLFSKQVNFEATLKESWNIVGVHSWLLNLNFIINLGLSGYLYVQLLKADHLIVQYPYLTFAAAFIFFFLGFITMTLAATLTGVKMIFGLPMQLAWVLPQFIGVILFILNLVWVLNPEASSLLSYVLIASLIVLSMQRLLRTSRYLLRRKIEWYYILLYLCTLETMPLLLVVWFLFDWTN
jgi:hypothetical protein